eukprot:45843_1
MKNNKPRTLNKCFRSCSLSALLKLIVNVTNSTAEEDTIKHNQDQVQNATLWTCINRHAHTNTHIQKNTFQKNTLVSRLEIISKMSISEYLITSYHQSGLHINQCMHIKNQFITYGHVYDETHTYRKCLLPTGWIYFPENTNNSSIKLQEHIVL